MKNFYRLYQFKRIEPTSEQKLGLGQFRPHSYNKYSIEKQSIEFKKQLIDNSCSNRNYAESKL